MIGTALYNKDIELQEKGLAWKEIRTEHIVQDRWIDFRKSAYRYPDGRVFEPFYTFSRKDYTVIVASDADGNYICVRQFRQGINEVTTEFPAGGIERADGREYCSRRQEEADANEAGNLRGVAIAEADANEAGNLRGVAIAEADANEAGNLQAVATTGAAAPHDETALDCAKRELEEETGYVSDKWTHLLTIPSDATVSDNYAHIFMAEDCRKTSEQHLDETECLHIEKLTANQIEERIHTGKFQQAVHVLAWMLAKEKRLR